MPDSQQPDHSSLVQQVARLQDMVVDLQTRVIDLECSLAKGATTRLGTDTTIALGSPTETVAGPERAHTGFTHLFGLTGRSIMILAVAFLLRFSTESGSVPPALGTALGISLGAGLLFLVPRAARNQNHPSALAHGLTAAAIALPLILESVTSLGIISYRLGAFYLAIILGLGQYAAWRASMRDLSWVLTAGGLGLSFVMIARTGQPVSFFLVMLGLGAVTCLLAYSRHWHLMRWAVAPSLGLLLLRMIITLFREHEAGSTGPGAGVVIILCLAYMMTYLLIFSWRALIQGRGVKVFDVLQSALAVLLGFGGAVAIARHVGTGTFLLGLFALGGAVTGYAVAFAFVSSRQGRGRAFFYFATMALVFLFIGSPFLAHGAGLTWSWVILGLATSLLGGKFHRVTLKYHAAAYLFFAAIHSGLLVSSLLGFVVPAGSHWPQMPTGGALTLLAVLAGYIILATTRVKGSFTVGKRLPQMALSALFLTGVGFFATQFLIGIFTDLPPVAEPSLLALARTLVIAITAVILSLVSRRLGLKELGWLVYPLLVIGCAKLLLEDLGNGTAITLAISFAALGAALVLGPRLLRNRENPAVDGALEDAPLQP